MLHNKKVIAYILLGDQMEQWIDNYIQTKLTEEDIKKFAEKENTKITDQEAKIIFLYLKNYWKVFYQEDAQELWNELKEQLSSPTYQKLTELYQKYKNKKPL